TSDSGYIILFFFSSRRRHTRSYGDWSSDVYSSDLPRRRCRRSKRPAPATAALIAGSDDAGTDLSTSTETVWLLTVPGAITAWVKIGRASCRERREGGVGRAGG